MQGAESPLFYCCKMIDKGKIVELAHKNLVDGMFLVDVTVSANNVINVYIDSNKGITIKDCIAISRGIEGNLDREKEDFELQVSSSGLGQPFKVIQQYINNIGKAVEVISKDGLRTEGVLIEANEDGIILETRKREKVEGHKKKQLIIKNVNFKMDNIKLTKKIISFK